MKTHIFLYNDYECIMILFTNYGQYYDKLIVHYMENSNKKLEKMKTQSREYTNPLVYAIINFINKLRQSPDLYPIKYYKKTNRHKQNWKTTLLK